MNKMQKCRGKRKVSDDGGVALRREGWDADGGGWHVL